MLFKARVLRSQIGKLKINKKKNYNIFSYVCPWFIDMSLLKYLFCVIVESLVMLNKLNRTYNQFVDYIKLIKSIKLVYLIYGMHYIIRNSWYLRVIGEIIETRRFSTCGIPIYIENGIISSSLKIKAANHNIQTS